MEHPSAGSLRPEFTATPEQGSHAQGSLHAATELQVSGLVRSLLRVAGGLGVAGVFGQLADRFLPDFVGRDFLADFTNLNGEVNLPTSFSILLLLTAALLLAVITAMKRRQRDRFVTGWAGLLGLFAFLTMDEFMSVHERLSNLIQVYVQPQGLLFYVWVLPYGLLVVAVAAGLGRFLVNLPPGTRNGFLAAGGLYVLGALGFELLEGLVAGGAGVASLQMLALTATEEVLEMAGIILFVGALLDYLRVRVPGWQVRLRP